MGKKTKGLYFAAVYLLLLVLLYLGVGFDTIYFSLVNGFLNYQMIALFSFMFIILALNEVIAVFSIWNSGG